MKLAGRVAVVTGGASGLGHATAVHLAREHGARVALLDLARSRGEALARELGGGASFAAVDVADEAAVAATVADIRAREGSIHVCVNCAGVPASTRLLDRSGVPAGGEAFRRALAVNLLGSFNVMAHCAAAMSANVPAEDGERGVIVNVASIAAFDGQLGHVAYSASKAGVVGMTLPAARELAALGIRVLAIAPGLFLTPMAESVPARALERMSAAACFPRRAGDPAEFARLVAHVCENAYLNAECIRLDAGARL